MSQTIATEFTVEEFAARARDWLAANMPRLDPQHPPRNGRDDEGAWQRARELQRRLYDGGFAGICFPREYGGLGLDIRYQKAFDVESDGYEMPLILNVPTFTICCATLLDTGSEEQKRRHIHAALRGEEVLVQLLSEPSGGSDLAGLITRADRDGDSWVISGAKTWSTSAFAADYGLLLARTDSTVPKHDGLTMFLMPIGAPGVTLRRIEQVDGSNEFCEEFFDGLRLGDDAVVGEVNKGWDVASRLLFHERRAVGQGSEFASGRGPERTEMAAGDFLTLAVDAGTAEDPLTQDKIGRVLARRMVRDCLVDHVGRAMRTGELPPAAGSLIRLFHSDVTFLEVDTAAEVAGPLGVVDDEAQLLRVGKRYLSRQTVALGGGSDEMARNVIAERVLGLPREYAADRGVPFNQVRHNRA
ncbi:acyl-CoA dehydrogenase family protein [Mycolicibacter kumamotonensis]|jgi:alkylation response protein AidB-like acyl-CoA dehydrogenase|uniref:Acyl-CoA dehydrogenase n=1 Tax=Mycolicibacter kumamotonensis TaxID=354243 RepID=A0A1B8SEF8_9MYCO|nr:acyl-CoA dehydrogenase family protein [Mycolicibacter kumamotonensis]NDJ89794.1 acyl-CoA dehydrogenase [Mycolicibacter kumamotonensis]OBY31094.1 acyl-CoA dehydrogenase [Mycolicibacter kumamotonensis]ORA80507.1 acyl-CoA dehydrogenase [Mycolicibacter kumamotonensis]